MNTSNIMSLNTASAQKNVSGSGGKSVKKSAIDGITSNKSHNKDNFSNVLGKSSNEETVSVDEAVKDPISAAIASAQQNSNEDAGTTADEMTSSMEQTDGQNLTLNSNEGSKLSADTRLISNSIEALMGNSQNSAEGTQDNQLLEMLTGVNTALIQNQSGTSSISQNGLNTAAGIENTEALVQTLGQEIAANQNAVLKGQMDAQPVLQSNTAEISDSAKSTMGNLLGDAKVEIVQNDNLIQPNTTGQQMKANLLEQQQQSFQQGGQAFSNSENLSESAEHPAVQTPFQNNSGISAFQQTIETMDAETQQVQETQQGRTDYDIPKQIVDQARLIRSGENTEMVIRLRPEHLGNLTLRISVTGNGSVNATFQSDNAQVRAIIESSMAQLKQDLENQGLKVNNVEVYSGLGDGLMQGGQSQSEYQQQQSNAARHSKLDMDALEDDMEQISVETSTEATNSEEGIDYRV